jgi:hypothetical protein
MMCAKSGQNWPNGSGEDFQMTLPHFYTFCDYPLGPLIEQTWIPFAQG